MRKLTLTLSIIFLLTFFTINVNALTLTDGLTHYWNFDETSGTIAEDNGGLAVNNMLNMTLTNAIFDGGFIGNALSCDGVNDQATSSGGTGGLPSGSGNWTLSFWTKSNESTTGIIYSSTTGSAERVINAVGGDLRVFFGGGDTGNINVPIVQDGTTWYHIVVKREDGRLLVYANSTQIANVTAAASISVGNIRLCEDSAGGDDYNGTVDEFGIWNRSLSTDAINLLYDFGQGNPYPFSIFNVRLNSPTNNTATSDINVTFNATFTPQDTNLTNATINLWYTNGTLANQTTNTVTGSAVNSTLWNLSLNLGSYKWNVLACGINVTGGTVCEYASSNSTLTNGFETISETYNSTTFETLTETFALNFSIPIGSTIGVSNFYYNNTKYSLTPISLGGKNYSLNKSILIPSVATQTNKNFFWEIIFTNGFGQNSTTQTQTIQKYQGIQVGLNCPAGFDPSLTFTFQDENLTNMNNSAEYNINYGLAADTTDLAVYGNITNVGSFNVCINSTLISVITGDVQIKYGGNGYVEKDFFVYSGISLTNDTNNHTLYNLGTSLATSFLVTIEDTSLTPYQNKYAALLRWYPELNQYNVVSMGETDENGQVIFKVITEDIDYRVGVYEKNGTLIKLAEPSRFVCLVNPCTYTLKVSPTDVDFTSALNVDYEFTYNETTSIWLFTYSDTTQLTSGMNLTVYKVTGTSVYPICSSFASSYTGALTCDTSAYSGTFRAVIYRSASPATPLTQKVISTVTTAFTSTFGLWLSLILGIPIVAVFAYMSPIAGIIGAVIMLIPAFYLGSINLAILGGIAVLAGIVLHFLKRIG